MGFGSQTKFGHILRETVKLIQTHISRNLWSGCMGADVNEAKAGKRRERSGNRKQHLYGATPLFAVQLYFLTDRLAIVDWTKCSEYDDLRAAPRYR